MITENKQIVIDITNYQCYVILPLCKDNLDVIKKHTTLKLNKTIKYDDTKAYVYTNKSTICVVTNAPFVYIYDDSPKFSRNQRGKLSKKEVDPNDRVVIEYSLDCKLSAKGLIYDTDQVPLKITQRYTPVDKVKIDEFIEYYKKLTAKARALNLRDNELAKKALQVEDVETTIDGRHTQLVNFNLVIPLTIAIIDMEDTNAYHKDKHKKLEVYTTINNEKQLLSYTDNLPINETKFWDFSYTGIYKNMPYTEIEFMLSGANFTGKAAIIAKYIQRVHIKGKDIIIDWNA